MNLRNIAKIQANVWYSDYPNTFLLFFVCCRKFIDMGFVDKDRIAIWGWVSFLFPHILGLFI